MLEQLCLLPTRYTHGPTLLGILTATLTLLIHSRAQETYSGLESYAIYPGWTGLSMQEGLLQLTFRTSSGNGLVLYAEGNDGGGREALAVMLEGGKISVKVERYGRRIFGTLVVFESFTETQQFYVSEKLNDNKAHTLSLQRTPDQFTVSVLDRSLSESSSLLASSSTIGSMELYVGGLPENVTSLFSINGHFTGCLEDIQFVNNSSNTSSLVSVIPLVRRGIVDGCSDPCANISCGGGSGTCVAVLPDRYFCDCSSTQMGGADCTEELSQHRLDLTLESHLCYTLDNYPFVNRAATMRLIAPVPVTGTIMTGIFSINSQFNLYIEEGILKLKLISTNRSVKLSAGRALDRSTSYQIDFEVREDSVELIVATIAGSVLSEFERLSRNLTFPIASIFTTVCVGGTMLEVPYYAGILERVIYNAISLSNASLSPLATVETPVNLISFSEEISEPPLTFERFNFANYLRITFEMRLEPDNTNAGTPIASRNDDFEIQFTTLNGQLFVSGTNNLVVSCPNTPFVYDYMWHRIDLTLTRNGNGTADFYITVDDQSCEITMDSDRTKFGELLTSLINSNAPLDFGLSKIDMTTNSVSTRFIGCFRNIEFRETVSSEPVRPDLALVIRSEERFGTGEECYVCRLEDRIPCQGGEVCVDCGFLYSIQCLDQASTCQNTVPPDQAHDLTVERFAATSISISWKPPITNRLRVQYYLINVNNSMNDDIMQVNTTTNVTFYNVTGLLPGTTYELTVVTVYTDGGANVAMSQASGSVTATTGFTDINECEPKTFCPASSICKKTTGSFECVCVNGTQMDHTGNCTDIDECREGNYNCSQHAICQNVPGSYTCECMIGFEGNGVDCTTIYTFSDVAAAGTSVAALFVVTVAVVVLLLSIAGIIRICKRATKPQYENLENDVVKSIAKGHTSDLESSSQGDQIFADQQAGIGDNSEVEGHIIIELKSLSSNAATDISLVDSTTYMTDTGKPAQTDEPTGILSDDGGLIQEMHLGGDRIQQVCQSTYFSIAEKTAKVPFLDHRMLECDCNGQECTNMDHDITVRIPEGAVAEGEKVHFEVGVAMYGPFIFPENTQPISPILWLCLLEEDAQLKKPFQIILPHYLTGLSKERIEHHQVRFVKANHNDYTFEDNHMSYKFHNYDTKPLLASSGHRNYSILISKHCCFYCLEAKLTPELAMDAGYCLVRIELCISPRKYEFYFAGIYFLDTCLRSLEEQFPRELGYRISRYDSFKFKDTDAFIQIIAPAEYDQYLVAFEPTHAKIMASDIMCWNEGFELMRRKHERNMYPPRVKMTVHMTCPSHSVKLPIKFSGCEGDGKLDIELILPLGFPPLSPTSSESLSGSHNSEIRSQAIICGKPRLKDVFKELLSLAMHWKTIGTLLGVSKPVLDKIRSDEEGANDRLHEMLSEWLKQTDPPPTWTALADAMEMIDSSKAQEIRKRCVDMPSALDEGWT